MKVNKKWLWLVLIFFGLFVRITKENKTGSIRYRVKIGLPFSHKKTYILIDKNVITGDYVIHLFDYNKELAYQFLGLKYKYSLRLYDVI